jgi:hypothetical protein
LPGCEVRGLSVRLAKRASLPHRGGRAPRQGQGGIEGRSHPLIVGFTQGFALEHGP